MKYRRKQKHFLLHTFEHLSGVVVVMAVAFMLAYVSKLVETPAAMLAEVAGSGTTTTTSTTNNFVTFSTSLVNTECQQGTTIAKYYFVITPIDAGYVVLNTPNGSDYVDITNGRGLERMLPVGIYSWSGVPRSGFTGQAQGSFTVGEVCSDANTGSTTTTNTLPPTQPPPPPPPPPPTTAPLIEVSFSTQPGPIANCMETGQPLTPVFFLVTQTAGGRFIVSSNTGMTNAYLEWGEYPLPNGTYSWKAKVNSGYVGVGALSGQFTLNNNCDGFIAPTPEPLPPPPPPPPATTVATTSTTTTTTLPPPPPPPPATTTTIQPTTDTTLQVLPRPVLSMFKNNTAVLAIPTPEFDDDEIELRIKTVVSSEVQVFVIDGLGGTKPLGKAVRDDLLSRPGVDLWTYNWDPSSFPEGTYRLGTKVIHEDGRNTLSERITIKVVHPPAPVVQKVPVTASSGQVTTSVQVTQAEKEAILERIADPGVCTNAEECRIFCENSAITDERCIQFARFVRDTVRERVEESLADGISNERLELLLVDSERRPKELPMAITNPLELKRYCASPDNAEVCTNVLVRTDLGAPEDLLAKRLVIERAREEERKVFTERIGVRAYIDSDKDGVTDYDELNLYSTDPTNADTDGDGFHDGAELLSRTNPLGGIAIASTMASSTEASTMLADESVVLENPNIAGVEEKELLKVTSIAVAETGMGASGTTTATKLRLSGRAVPNSFVTLYIFSDPIVVTVKTDAAGAWVYTLDKELPDGSHQIYSAITNAGGRILAKSEPLPFVKEAAAVSLISANAPIGNEEPGFFAGASLYAMIAVLIGILGAALSIIGFMVRERKTEGVETGPSDPTPA